MKGSFALSPSSNDLTCFVPLLVVKPILSLQNENAFSQTCRLRTSETPCPSLSLLFAADRIGCTPITFPRGMQQELDTHYYGLVKHLVCFATGQEWQ